MPTSEEIKQQILNVSQGLPESQTYDAEGGYGENDVGIESEDFQLLGGEEDLEQVKETPEEFSQRMWNETQEEEAQEKREAEAERQQAGLDYLEKRIKSSGSEEAFFGNLQNAMVEDFRDLKFKYAPNSQSPLAGVIDRFGFEFDRGKIRLSPQTIKDSDAPHEQLFLRWLSKPSVMRDLSMDQIREAIEIGARGEPLRSRAKEIMAPHAMHPKKQRRR